MMLPLVLNVRMNMADDGPVLNTAVTGELSAEQIVRGFAENRGLSLADVYSNYTQYADAIQQSFTSQHRKLFHLLYICS